MPKKKSKKGKRGKKDKDTAKVERDPVAPDFIIPPPKPRENLVKLLTAHPVEERELHGFKVSTRALDKLTPQEIRDLRIVFDAFDANQRGVLGVTEVKKSLRVLGFKLNREEVKQTIKEVSSAGRGVISFNEFLDIVIDRQGDSRDMYDEIMQGFKLFDYDNAGKLSLDNVKEACQEVNVKFTKQELEDMMEEADTNGDGFIDKDEFTKIMMQTNLFC